MTFQTTLDQKALKEIAIKKSGIENVFFCVAIVIIGMAISILGLVAGIQNRNRFFILLALIPILEVVFLGGSKIWSIFMQPSQFFKKHKISEYVTTIEFMDDCVNVSNNIQSNTAKIKYERVKECISSERYLIFITKSQYSFSVLKRQISEIGIQQFEDFVREKMPQVKLEADITGMDEKENRLKY